MKLVLSLIACAIVSSAAFSQQELKVPAPSPSATVKQNFGISSVELSFSRPGVKGRKIFGDLVPYDKVWRTGANSPTTITFGDDVTIGGTKIPAGKYGLPVSYTHLRAHETPEHLVCRLLLEKKKK